MVSALVLGVPYDVFWHLTPKKLESFYKADEIKRQRRDEENWILGRYVLSAVSVAIEHNLAGKNAKTKYIENPFLQELEIGLTEEERNEKELQKMLLAEEMWIKQAKRKGLPETKII